MRLRGNVLRNKVVVAVGILVATASAVLTLLPWVDVTRLGVPMRWNGLGKYVGEYREHYGALLSGMVNSWPGWIVLIASIAAAGALVAATRARWLPVVACGCAIVAFATVVSVLVFPALLVGGIKHELGASGIPDRQFLNPGALIAEAVTTTVLVTCTLHIALWRSRRKPSYAPATSSRRRRRLSL